MPTWSSQTTREWELDNHEEDNVRYFIRERGSSTLCRAEYGLSAKYILMRISVLKRESRVYRVKNPVGHVVSVNPPKPRPARESDHAK